MLRSAVAAGCVLVMLGCGGQAGIDVPRRDARLPGGELPGADAGAEQPARPPELPRPPPMLEEPEEPPPFVDPGCPPVTAPPPDNECDPLASASTCPADQSCFPYVVYPSQPCEVEQYGSRCQLVGPGTQGDPCSRQGCAAEHICISTSRGTQCARICSFAPSAPDVCAPGLLCLPIDIEGFGGCL